MLTDPMRRVSVVILNWNAANDTIRSVQSMADWRGLETDIWIVDNASHDGSTQQIREQCPHVHLICSTTNLGFGGGNNRGIERALANGDAPILLLNNDATIEGPDMAELLHTLDSRTQLGCVGPLIFDRDEEQRLLSAGGRDIARHIQTHITRFSTREPLIEVDYVPGTVILVRAAAIRQVGLLDETYFFSAEIADLCERMRQQGYLCGIDTRARAFHKRHTVVDDAETLRTYYSIRNRFLFISKFRSKLRYGLWLLRALGMSFKADLRRDHIRARAIRYAVQDALQGRFGNQNERILSIAGLGKIGL